MMLRIIIKFRIVINLDKLLFLVVFLVYIFNILFDREEVLW